MEMIVALGKEGRKETGLATPRVKSVELSTQVINEEVRGSGAQHVSAADREITTGRNWREPTSLHLALIDGASVGCGQRGTGNVPL